MKLRSLTRFYDLREKTMREVDDEFVVTKERGEEIISSPFCIVEVVEEKKKVTKKKSGE